MEQYDAAKDKRRRWRCGIRPVYIGPVEIIFATLVIAGLIALCGFMVVGFFQKPNIDFRIADVCGHMRLIDHPVATPKEGSRLLVHIHVSSMEQLGNAIDQALLLVDRLDKAELHVSLSINHFLDLAQPWVDMFQSLLKSKRIPFVYFFEGEREALQSLWDRSYDATHVIAIKDSFFCAEDILRLYWQIGEPSLGPKLACGVQFAGTRKRQLALDLPDSTLHALGISRDSETAQEESPTLKSILTGYTTEVKCCWSNIVAISGDLLLTKPEHHGDCFGYDCQKICDMSRGAKMVPSVPVVPDHNTRSLIAVAPLHPQVHPQATVEL